MAGERMLTLECPKTGNKFGIAFRMDSVCHEPLYVPCPYFPPKISPESPKVKERGEISVEFIPMSEQEIKETALRVTGTTDSYYEDNAIIQIYCANCGFYYRRLFEA